MIYRYLLNIAILGSCISPLNAYAEGDNKPSIPLNPLTYKQLTVITNVVGESTEKYVKRYQEGEMPKPDLKDMPKADQYRGMGFPVRTEKLSVGNVKVGEGSKFNLEHIYRPIAIVGDDEISREWLTRYSEQLKSRKATVFVVNVESSERFKQLEQLAPDVYFQAVNGDRFHSEYRVSHYPFYISKETGVLH